MEPSDNLRSIPRRDLLRLAALPLAAAGLAAAGVVVPRRSAAASVPPSQPAPRSAARSSTLTTCGCAAGSGSTVKTSDYGYDPADSTAALQAALDSTADVVVIDDVGGPWITGPLFVNRDAFTIYLEEDVVLQAKAGAFPGQMDALLTIDNKQGVSIVGYGAQLIMNKEEYAGDGQWRHALNTLSATDLLVEGVTLRKAGGDGVYLGASQLAGALPYGRSITLRNIWCDANYRNGLSVISVDGLTVEGSVFTNSSGVVQAGVDFEPNSNDHRLADIVVRDCVFDANTSYNVVISLHAFPGATQELSLLFDRIRIGNQGNYMPAFVYAAPPTGDPGGRIEIRDSLIQKGPLSGLISCTSKNSTGAALIFTRAVAIDWGNTFSVYEPITLEARTVPEHGGITLTDTLLVTDLDKPFLRVRETATTVGLRAIHGNITVVNPHGASTSLGADPEDVTLDIRALTAIPAASVGVEARMRSVFRGDPIELTFTRSSADLAAPLAVRYKTSGTAVERLDYFGSPGMVVIPPGESQATVVVPTRQRPGCRTTNEAVITIDDSPTYAIGAQATVSVSVH